MADMTSKHDDHDLLEELRAEVMHDPGERAAYEDARRWTRLLSAMPKIRGNQGLTQANVAECMGTTQSAVSDLETGRADPRLKTLQRYARAVRRRLDLALVDPDLPVYDEGMANGLWRLVEQKAQGPLLTALTTQIDEEDRTLQALSQTLDIPPAVVRPILASLVDGGWVTTTQERGEQVYAFNSDAGSVIGVSLHSSEVVGVLMNLGNQVLERTTERLANTQTRTVVEAALSVVARLYQARGRQRLLGVGVTLAGVVDEFGTVRFAPDLRCPQSSWSGFELGATLQAEAQAHLQDENLRVAVENDANALATLEHLLSGRRSVGVVLLSDTGGIGAGFTVDGRQMHGETHAAGEGGHVVVQPGGAQCRTGASHNGCLETVASAQSVLDGLGIPASGPRQLTEGMAAANDRVRRGEQVATQAFEDAGDALGQFLATTIMLFDPSEMILYGRRELVYDDDYPSARHYREGIRTGLRGALSKEDHMPNPRLTWRVTAEETTATAAGSVALQHFLDRPAHWVPSVLRPRTLGGGTAEWH